MFLQENWFHDCDNEHAKITAFFQVIGVRKLKIRMRMKMTTILTEYDHVTIIL